MGQARRRGGNDDLWEWGGTAFLGHLGVRPRDGVANTSTVLRRHPLALRES